MGGLLGAALGHAFDSESQWDANDQDAPNNISGSEKSQITFFVGAFSMLGKVARADGYVKTEGMQSVENFMTNDLNLNSVTRKIAMSIFEKAVLSNDSFTDYANQFYQEFKHQPQILELMLDVLLRVAAADGEFSSAEESLIRSAADTFRSDSSVFDALKSKYNLVSDSHYAVLNSIKTDDTQTIKKRYRNLVREYHPDTIASKGLPEEFMKFANDKFVEIQEAYEAIKKERHF